MNAKIFALIACRRTGSNYLMKILDSFPDIEFFGEIYHWDTVWMPISRKLEYIDWLKTEKDIHLSIGQKPFEDRSLVELNHKNPHLFLKFLGLTSKSNYAGFKIFPEHLPWPKLQPGLLKPAHITKIVLKRNLLNVYISDQILQQTKQSQKYDTSNIKIKINCAEFKHWFFTTQSYFSRIELYLKNSGQKYLELSYEDIHCHDSNEQKVKYIHSWFVENGFDLKNISIPEEYTKKQDKRSNPLAKVLNAQELEEYLKSNNLQYLIVEE